jgi:predicted DNA-binding transcriptional regulator YafY
LARQFEVSVRTIYRDIDALSASGVPVFAETGRNGGIALHDGYRTRLTGLTLAEAAALPIAGLSYAARDLGVSVEAAAAQLKILASLSPETGAAAQRIAQRFHCDPIAWYHRSEEVAHLPELAGAVWAGKKVAIAYESWQGGIRKRLNPLGLVLKGGLWYLVAAERNRPRTYRIANIQQLSVLDLPASRPQQFDLAVYWQNAARAFERRLMAHRAIVRISEEGERILRAVMPAAAEIVATTRQPRDQRGWARAEMPIESPEYSARQLLRLGAEVEVLEPPAVRDAILRETRAVGDLYSPASRRRVRRAKTPS